MPWLEFHGNAGFHSDDRPVLGTGYLMSPPALRSHAPPALIPSALGMPFLPPRGSDRIPIACRPAVKLERYYPADLALILLCLARRIRAYSLAIMQ